MQLNKAYLEQVQPDSLQADSPQPYPIRVLQMGDGIFLRGFVDWLLHQLNERNGYRWRVAVVKPRRGGTEKVEAFRRQDGLFTVWIRGIENGSAVERKEVVTSVGDVLSPYTQWEDFLAYARRPEVDIFVSNTTEAGLTYTEEALSVGRCPESFPAKLTAYLYERWRAFSGDVSKGIDIVPCELVEDNGLKLKEYVLRHIKAWGLPSDFAEWVTNANTFYNTLVDSIVTSFEGVDVAQMKHEFAYTDDFGVVREPFYQWVIEGRGGLSGKWPFATAGFNVKYVQDVTPYRLTKVRILNGAHTALAGLASLAGVQTVRQAVTHPVLGPFVQNLIEREVLPTLPQHGVASADAENFAVSVMERFANPFLHHQIASLQLNALAKICTRILPTLRDATRLQGEIPPRLATALAGQLLYYRPQKIDGVSWEIRDNPDDVQAVQGAWTEAEGDVFAAVSAIFRLESVWGEDLTEIPGLVNAVAKVVQRIQDGGVTDTLSALVSQR